MTSSTFVFGALGTEDGLLDSVTSVCIGTGRFLRAMLVPALTEVGGEVILAQTRGTSFPQYMASRAPARSYEVDTVLQDGTVMITEVPVAACGTLGKTESRTAFMALPKKLPKLRYIGLGLTEAGIEHNGRSILDLAEFLYSCFEIDDYRRPVLSVLNTDNMPFNGDAVRGHVCSCDFTQNASEAEKFEAWLAKRVCFHNTMVDRITSHREGCPDVPRAEPLPSKALVIEDLQSVLPWKWSSVPGVKVRAQPGQLVQDITLKLRIANGIHTAMVYAMALVGLFKTDSCVSHRHVLPYLEQLFERDIVHCCSELKMPRLSVTPVFSEWMARLQHKHFGLECFFVCQNATQKMGIRLMPSVLATLAAGEVPSDFVVFALAVILRFLTPVGDQPRLGESPPVFVGRLDDFEEQAETEQDDFSYVPGLHVRPSAGSYEFRDGDGIVPLLLRPLGRPSGCSVTAATSIAGEVLSRLDGFDFRSSSAHAVVVERVGVMLKKMLDGEASLDVLADLNPKQPLVLDERHLEEAVKQEVEAAEAIDVHTHLFPASHGETLMEYGIDAMLTYHYLVSEYLAKSSESPQDFFRYSRSRQAEHVWEGLFVKASPLSEPCRGVLTTLMALGLKEELARRDLAAIRQWYKGQDAEMFNEKMMRLARLRYVVTSHDPFDEAQLDSCLKPPQSIPRYRSALALDQLIEGNWPAVCAALKATGKPATLRAVKALVLECVMVMKPGFVTASTSEGFSYSNITEGRKVPDEYWDHNLSDTFMDLKPTAEQVLDNVVLPICEEYSLPLSLRMGTRRAVQPALKLAGDGVGTANLQSLGSLCEKNQQIKFMFTVLSRNDQHEAAVLASKFRNLHVWGSWWYCNYTSVVSEVTSLRLEMLGTNFTFQTSSARVHDQLIYKWIHARSTLEKILLGKYRELASTGWAVSRGDIRRDVQSLLGGAFEEFLAKKL
mmetsp:Transcript_58313/g.103599  ORF Transcript_58313/g.103599 Transcript_58313/m.103599 type:complete len:949 (+) Transcript_58313:80-2926(+)|eukprot:CAMPEP_0197669004 /NCGR_PEP_ID=MMETSP1338-20131121/70820_1 /TAXON_ID=43686 ORGANISM="Pelagodinium beii, Strain RCC1491" /NCGR_SAMPLE_ID=MMETSP1338 /ASSEMBLY_ACC=CAM_ASM_000754 /LENGTH=948 /DNA_ID=CAMNT_0043248481 /DNA_START=9 /DNA_END=2855 /DNA_ORIENTATION=+